MISSLKLAEYIGSDDGIDFDRDKEHVVGIFSAEGVHLLLGGLYDEKGNPDKPDLPAIYVERQQDKWLVIVSQDYGDATLQLKIPLDPDKPVLAESNCHPDSMEFKR